MELFISTACDETRTFGESTLMRSVIEERYLLLPDLPSPHD